MHKTEDYSHDAFLDTLSYNMRIAVEKFLATNKTCALLETEILSNEKLRDYIDKKLDEELESLYGSKKN